MNKKFIKNFIITFFILIASTIVFNYNVDSLSIFKMKKELTDIAKGINQNKIIIGLSNSNDRLLQKLIIENQKKKVDYIALGSSRIMYLQKEYFLKNNKKFFNHWVSGASIEDYLSIIALYLKTHNYLPKNILIGIDPWIFNENREKNNSDILSVYSNFTMRLLKIKKMENTPQNRYKELLNWEYTKENIKYLKNKLKNNNTIKIVTNPQFYDNYKNSDGSIHVKKFNLNQNLIKHHITKLKNTYIPYIDRFTKINNKQIFEKFIFYLKEQDVNVTFILLPYHPYFYDFIEKDSRYSIVNDVEKYINKYAKQNHIQVYGSYNPYKFNFTEKYFLDEMHGIDLVIKKIILKYKQKDNSVI